MGRHTRAKQISKIWICQQLFTPLDSASWEHWSFVQTSSKSRVSSFCSAPRSEPIASLCWRLYLNQLFCTRKWKTSENKCRQRHSTVDNWDQEHYWSRLYNWIFPCAQAAIPVHLIHSCSTWALHVVRSPDDAWERWPVSGARIWDQGCRWQRMTT